MNSTARTLGIATLLGCMMTAPVRAVLSTGYYSIGGDFGLGISADGTTVVGKSAGQAFRWTLVTGRQPLPFLSGHSASEARAVSGDGSVVVGWSGPTVFASAVSWSAAGVLNLGDLPGRNPGGHAFGISDDGLVISGDADGLAFRWTQATGMQSIGFLNGIEYSYANNISGNGSVIVGSAFDGVGSVAFRWTQASGMQSIGRLAGATDALAYEVSYDGSVVVGWSGSEAFRWTQAGGMQGLGVLPGATSSKAWGVSGDGSIVVGECITPSLNIPFIWDAVHGMRNLETVVQQMGVNLGGARLVWPTGISADGSAIVGTGSGGAWLVVIPEPDTAALLAIGTLVVVWRSRPITPRR